MSGLVYAGVAQLVAMEVWRPEWSWGAIAGLAVRDRHRQLPGWCCRAPRCSTGSAVYPKRLNALQLFFFTDANWLIGTRYHAEGGRDLGVLIGAGILLWVVWVAATLPGYLLGALVADPRTYGIDLVMPIFFAAMIVPLWRGKRAAIPWVVAGVAALVTAKLVDGYVFIIVGSLPARCSGAFLDDPA